jgi:hypothetical protein
VIKELKVILKLKCNQCQNEMITDCGVSVEADTYGLRIFKKSKGLFNKVSGKPKASACPIFGYLAFYIENFKEFK